MLFASEANAARTIVGTWDFEGQNCLAPIRIGPKSLVSDDVNCTFATVSRKGDVVTWKGVCDSAEGSSAQTVIASLSQSGSLTIRYVPGGNVLENLWRCP